MSKMLITHTIEIQARIHNSAKRPLNTRVVTQGNVYGACIVATATQHTVDMAAQELARDEAKTAELKRELAEKLQTLGFESEVAFHAAYKAGGDSRMGLVTDIRDLSIRIQKRCAEADQIRKVYPRLGDQFVVIWKSSVEAAQNDLKTARFTHHRHQGYVLDVRTDFTTTAKPERSKAA